MKKTVLRLDADAPDASGFSGKINLTFESEGSFYIDYIDDAVVQIDDLLRLAHDIHALGDRWNRNRYVITEVELAGGATSIFPTKGTAKSNWR